MNIVFIFVIFKIIIFSLPPQNLNKESVAVMGWKVIKATVKGYNIHDSYSMSNICLGVSVMNQLIPKDDDHEGDVPVFEDPPYLQSLDPADNIPLDLKNVPISFEPSKNELDLRIPEIPEIPAKENESDPDLAGGLQLKPPEERPIEEKPQPPIIQPAASRQQVIISIRIVRINTAIFDGPISKSRFWRFNFRQNAVNLAAWYLKCSTDKINGILVLGLYKDVWGELENHELIQK